MFWYFFFKLVIRGQIQPLYQKIKPTFLKSVLSRLFILYWFQSFWVSRNMCKLCLKFACILLNIFGKILAGLRLRATIMYNNEVLCCGSNVCCLSDVNRWTYEQHYHYNHPHHNYEKYINHHHRNTTYHNRFNCFYLAGDESQQSAAE